MPPFDSSSVSLTQAQRIDQLCDAFESAWQRGERPALAAFVEQAAPRDRPQAADELAAIDQAYRSRLQSNHPPPSAPCLPAAAPSVLLTVTGGPNQGQSLRFDSHDTLVVGRGRAAQWKLPPRDKFFSRHHFLLEVNPPACRLTNLSLTNGTLVNGERIDVRHLHDGDLILAGDTAIQVTISAPPSAPGPIRARSTHASTHFGGYRAVRELGRGGMGVVHLVADERTGQQRALKTLRTDCCDPREVRRFLREAQVCQRLKHPHIVAHYGSGQEGETVYFVMEYVAGEDAAQLLRRTGRLTLSRAVAWACQLLLALDYAHNQGYVHRDIKPSNLLIGQTGGREHLKLADFGLVHAYQSSSLSGLTLDGEVGGSLPFMAPEQLTHFRHVDPRSDLFSVGATLYNLVTGTYAYDFPPRVADRFTLVLQNKLVPLDRRRPDLPPEFVALIARATASDPAHRFASAAEFRQALLPFAAENTPP